MKLFKFQSILFCLLIIGAGLAISGSANAAGKCNAGQFGGDCKTACDATEANILEVYTKEAPDMSQCIGYEFCCVKKGNFLCSQLGLEVGSHTKDEKFVCSPTCTTRALVEVGGAAEPCDGSNICCRMDQAASPTKTAAPTGKPTGSPITLTNKLGAGATIFAVMQRVITMFLGVVGALALGVFVYAGVLWMTAGSSDRVQKAKDALKYAVIGLFMIAFAYSISAFFFSTLAGGGAAKKAVVPEFAAPPPIND